MNCQLLQAQCPCPLADEHVRRLFLTPLPPRALLADTGLLRHILRFRCLLCPGIGRPALGWPSFWSGRPPPAQWGQCGTWCTLQ